jgi:hypothetical protein
VGHINISIFDSTGDPNPLTSGMKSLENSNLWGVTV